MKGTKTNVFINFIMLFCYLGTKSREVCSQKESLSPCCESAVIVQEEGLRGRGSAGLFVIKQVVS